MKNRKHIRSYLLPLAWLYGLGVGIRNKMFDIGLLRSRSFAVPVINVGNITVGGTGKTPHTEYLIRLLSHERQVAVLSRGYKRKSKGYRLATATTTMPEIGDEPYQMKRKFPAVHVAVDTDRCHGIEQLMRPEVEPRVDVVLLDDAYQHRYVKPGLNILLTDCNRLIYNDALMPAGRLREPVGGLRRADIVIVTKCKEGMTMDEQREIERRLCLNERQKLFYTYYIYSEPYRLFCSDSVRGYRPQSTECKLFGDLDRNKDIVLLTGIASPQPLVEYVQRKLIPEAQLTTLHFPDHHAFTPADIADIERQGRGKTIITTEKDATRLQSLGKEVFSPEVADSIYVLPIEVAFLNGQQTVFNQIVVQTLSEITKN